VLLALVGEWVAHAATWFLTGGATPGHALSGATHTYLRPVGLALVGSAVLVSWFVWRGLQHLGAMAASFRSAARRAGRLPSWPGSRPPGHGTAAAAPASVRPGQLWGALLSVQLAVYLVQENVEAHAAGLATPGLHVLTAHHGSALVVHAAVALLAAMLAVEVGDRWVERRHDVAVAARAYRAVTWRRTIAPAGLRHDAVVSDSPLDRIGRSILSRPPPLLSA
jgi:hypothetical protein